MPVAAQPIDFAALTVLELEEQLALHSQAFKAFEPDRPKAYANSIAGTNHVYDDLAKKFAISTPGEIKQLNLELALTIKRITGLIEAKRRIEAHQAAAAAFGEALTELREKVDAANAIATQYAEALAQLQQLDQEVRVKFPQAAHPMWYGTTGQVAIAQWRGKLIRPQCSPNGGIIIQTGA